MLIYRCRDRERGRGAAGPAVRGGLEAKAVCRIEAPRATLSDPLL